MLGGVLKIVIKNQKCVENILTTVCSRTPNIRKQSPELTGPCNMGVKL